MINYNAKIKSMLKRILAEENFVCQKGNAFFRTKNDVPQSIFFEKSRLWNSIWISNFSNLNNPPYYTDDRYISEYFFESDEDFYIKLDFVEREFREKWIPYFNRKAEEYNITTSMMKAYNEKTDEYVQKVLENNRFPENVEELIDIVKKIYHGKETFDKTKKDEVICMAASLYWEYLFKIHPEYKAFGGECLPKKVLNHPHYQISPLRVAFSSFMTDDYDEFKSGTRIWDVEENSTWVRKEKWEQKIY